MKWNLEQLKIQLSNRSEVKSWIVSQEHVHRRERYFMLDSPGGALVADQDREVHGQAIEARIIVRLEGKAGRQGEITQKLFPALPLKEQLDAAIGAAQQTDHQAWDLPSEIPSRLPPLATTDPRMAEDLERCMTELSRQVESAVSRKRNTLFNSAELFLSVHDRELHLSNGLVHRSSQSRLYSESAYSFTRAGTSDEYLSTRWAVNMDDLDVARLFDETSDRAEHSLDVRKPETGRYPVIVDAEVLATLFNNHVTQLSAANAYNGLPYVKPGDELIPGLTGDAISILLDPFLEYGADTTALSEQGILQNPLKLVDKNIVVATATDKRYGDYLGVRATTVRGNVVVDPGALTHQQLTQAAPKVLEILQFSGLFADPNSGTFSSEIRLARLYDNEKKKVTYVKGGSLSGSFVENFKGARFSRDRARHAHFSSGSSQGQGYYGPAYALLSDVSIVG